MCKSKPSDMDLIFKTFDRGLDKKLQLEEVLEDVLCVFIHNGRLDNALKVAKLLGHELTRYELEVIAKVCLNDKRTNDAREACDLIVELYGHKVC